MKNQAHLLTMPKDCIAIVDDADEHTNLLQSALELAGYQVQQIPIANALAELQASPPALVVLNLHESESQAYQLTRQLRQRKDLPFMPIALMIDRCPAAMVAVMDAGADDFIYRPIAPTELLARVRALLRLKRSIDDREAMVSMREEFVYRLTHDLKTPLVAADRVLGLLQRGKYGDLPDSAIQVLNSMQHNNQDLLEMTKTLLDIYRYESGQKFLTTAQFNLLKLADSVIDELHPLAAEKGIFLAVQPIDRSTINPADYYIEGARIELRRVLVNLVGNAIKFTASGSITVEFNKLPRILEMTLQDTGCGIDPQDIPVVFERAYQGSHRYSGNGLGLNLTRQIVEAHGGKISVSSQLGQGSTFTVLLPLSSTDRLMSRDE